MRLTGSVVEKFDIAMTTYTAMDDLHNLFKRL